MKSIFRNFTIFLLIILLIVLILLTSFVPKIYNEKLYAKLHNESGVYETFDKSLVNEKSVELISFFKTGSELDKKFYSEIEIIHLNDVKKVFDITKLIYYILISIFILGLISLYFFGDYIQSVLELLSIQLILFVIIGLILYFTPFEILFESMHETFFPQGNYSFNPAESNLINLFPINFFIGFFQKILISFLIYESLILILILILYVIQNKHIFKAIFK